MVGKHHGFRLKISRHELVLEVSLATISRLDSLAKEARTTLTAQLALRSDLLQVWLLKLVDDITPLRTSPRRGKVVRVVVAGGV